MTSHERLCLVALVTQKDNAAETEGSKRERSFMEYVRLPVKSALDLDIGTLQSLFGSGRGQLPKVELYFCVITSGMIWSWTRFYAVKRRVC